MPALQLKLSVDFFYFCHCILQRQDFCLLYFMLSIYLPNFSFCSCIFFLISFSCLSVFPCISLNFFKIVIILDYFSDNLRISTSFGGGYWNFISSLGCVMFVQCFGIHVALC